jgi:NTP pyrophosphatase (non-canonical NTP hydrolase)
MTFNELEQKVILWGKQKGLITKKEGESRLVQVYAQTLKIQEETGELCRAILKADMPLTEDSIGDSAVTLILLCELLDLSFESCLEIAYKEIADRKTKLVNGTLIKE